MNDFIVIVGLSATGKTTLSEKYSKDYAIIHTDDFIRYKHQAPYYLDKAVKQFDNAVMEGVGAIPYLSDMDKYNFVKPNRIINCVETKSKRVARLTARKMYTDKSFAMDKMYEAIWNRFLVNNKIPIYTVMNMGKLSN